MISHLQMVTVFVTDLDRAVDFYVNQLGFIKTWSFDGGENDQLIWVAPKEWRDNKRLTQIALSLARPDDPRVGAVSGVVFSAENIQSTYNELKAKGVTFTLDLIRHPYGEGDGDQEARFIDPDGNEFLLHT